MSNREQCFLTLLCLGILGCIACGDTGSPTNSVNAAATASFSIRLSKTATDLIDRVEIVVTGSDMTEVRQELSKQGEVYSHH